MRRTFRGLEARADLQFFLLVFRRCVTGRHSVDGGKVFVEPIGAHQDLNHIDCGHRGRERQQKVIRMLYVLRSLYALAG